MTKARLLTTVAAIAIGLGIFGAAPAMAEDGATGSGVVATTSIIPGIAVLAAGLAVIGAAMGIGRIGSATVESIARQPEASGAMFTPMIITAAMIEGAAFFAIIVVFVKG